MTEIVALAAAIVLAVAFFDLRKGVYLTLAAGCPVVVTPEVGIAETVARSGSGIVVKGEPVSLAAVLRQAIHDPAGRERMGVAGRRTAENEFGWPAVARTMTNAYAEICKQG